MLLQSAQSTLDQLSLASVCEGKERVLSRVLKVSWPWALGICSARGALAVGR
jgi:hypothetical protein